MAQINLSPNEFLQFLTFDITFLKSNIHLAINVQKVKEVVEFGALTVVSGQDSAILGIYDLRECAIPVLNLNSIFPKEQNTDLTHKRIMICEIENLWIGVPVSKMGRIINCKSTNFLPPPPGSRMENATWVAGLVRIQKSFVPILDIEKIVSFLGMKDTDISPIDIPKDRFHGKRILIVDDSKVVLKKLNHLFTNLGCVTTPCSNGEEAISQLAKNNYQYDLIFTDIEMPQLDGLNMARRIKSNPNSSSIPIVFNSSLSNPSLIQDTVSQNLGQYLVKFDESLILQTLNLLFSK